MIIKSFAATSSAAALKLVREEMGGDAIVLKTTRVHDRINGNQVEITACLEKPSVDQSSRLLIEPERKIAASAQATSPVDDVVENNRQPVGCKDTVKSVLLQADLNSQFVDDFVQELSSGQTESENDLENALTLMSSKLADVMLPGLEFKVGDRLLFVGPAGSGKSSVLGKMAAHLVTRSKMKVRLATLDDMKVGAIDEIQNYADFLDLELAEPESEPTDDSITLIDAPSLNLGDNSAEIHKSKITSTKPDYCFLVVSALMRSSDISRYVTQAAELDSATHLIITMLDQTDALGGIMAAATASGLKVAFVTDSPGGLGMITSPDPHLTARRILQIKDECEQA